MNRQNSIFVKMMLCITLLGMSFLGLCQETTKPTIAVLNIDSRGVNIDSASIGYMVRLELEKTHLYTVMDRYEVAEVINRNKIDVGSCFSKSCLVSTGKLLGVNKMLGGSAELLGEKIVITLRLVDVATGNVERTDATEYLNLPEIQKMIRISVQKVVGITPDEVLVNQLIDYDVPIQSPKNTLRLNGPRMGFAYVTGDAAKILTSPTAKGGFDMYPVSFEFGWQQEFQYISAGTFQALIENVFMISGLESGRFIPNEAPMLGFRFGKNAWEFAFGPTFRLVNKADGYYDDKGNWHLQKEWDANTAMPSTYVTDNRLDSRGSLELSTGLVIAFGRTFHSGYLNIPLNIYVAPRRDGTNVGATFGFNIQKKDRAHKVKRYKPSREEYTDQTYEETLPQRKDQRARDTYQGQSLR